MAPTFDPCRPPDGPDQPDDGSVERAALVRSWLGSMAQCGQGLTDAELLEAVGGLAEQLRLMVAAEERLAGAAK